MAPIHGVILAICVGSGRAWREQTSGACKGNATGCRNVSAAGNRTFLHKGAGLLQRLSDGLQELKPLAALAGVQVAGQGILQHLHGCRQMPLAPEQL